MAEDREIREALERTQAELKLVIDRERTLRADVERLRRHASGETTPWEYKFHHEHITDEFGGGFSVPDFQKKFAEFGSDGWELVAAIDLNRRGGQSAIMQYIFKRPSR